jgi:hypothetical protein
MLRGAVAIRVDARGESQSGLEFVRYGTARWFLGRPGRVLAIVNGDAGAPVVRLAITPSPEALPDTTRTIAPHTAVEGRSSATSARHTT